MSNRQCNSSTGKKDSVLQTKHIRKFKFRGNNSDGWKGYTSEGYVNNSSIVQSQPEKNRKRKMISGTGHSTKAKIARMGLAEDIQQQIDDQIRMREGAMKLMSACSTLNQALETSKNLLTINGRILGLMSALQKKKQETVLQEYNRQRSSVASESAEDACTGRIAISDMRIPLMWKDNAHFTGKTGDQSYYAFALIRCGDQIRDTPLYEITSADTDMYFDLTLVFDDLHPDFKMDFEVYYTVITSNEAHGVRAPMRTAMKLHAQKRVVHFNAPKFCLAGHVHITIDDVRPGIISKDLTMGGKGASGVAVLGDIHEFPIHPLELWGQICFQLAAQPNDMFEDVHNGHIDIEINSPANRYYCILRQDCLHCWDDEDHTLSSKPVHSIKIEPNMKVIQVQHSEVSSIKLVYRESESVIATFTFDSSMECYDWKLAIRKQIANVVSWKHAFKEKMHIEETKKSRLSVPSTASFYDQIKIEEITSVTHVKQSPLIGHGIVNEAFNTVQTDNNQPELTNNHAEENMEIAKKQSYEKTYVNTSAPVPTSNPVTASNQTDQGQAPSSPNALLLQNGLPPSGLQKVEIAEQPSDGDGVAKGAEKEEPNVNTGENDVSKTDINEKDENVEKIDDIVKEEKQKSEDNKTESHEQKDIEVSGENSENKQVTGSEESWTQDNSLNIQEKDEESETEKDQSSIIGETIDKNSDEVQKSLDNKKIEPENVDEKSGSVVENDENKESVSKDDETSEDNKKDIEAPCTADENKVSADDIKENASPEDTVQDNETKVDVEGNENISENVNEKTPSESIVKEDETKGCKEEEKNFTDNSKEISPPETAVSSGSNEVAEENKKSTDEMTAVSESTELDTEIKGSVEENKSMVENVDEKITSETTVDESEPMEIVEDNMKGSNNVDGNTLSDSTVEEGESKDIVNEKKEFADATKDVKLEESENIKQEDEKCPAENKSEPIKEEIDHSKEPVNTEENNVEGKHNESSAVVTEEKS